MKDLQPMKHFTVEIRKDCAVCGADLPTPRHRTYCSKQCRTKAEGKRYAKKRLAWGIKHRGKFDTGKLQCLVCGLWYVQVATHVLQVHKMDARTYKEEYDLPVSRGVIPPWYRELKGGEALDNGTYKNLEAGASKRYVKGDPRAKERTGWKGRAGSKGYTDY